MDCLEECSSSSTGPPTCATSLPCSSWGKSFEGASKAPTTSPLPLLPERAWQGRLLGPEGETCPLRAGRGVDRGGVIKPSRGSSAPCLVGLRRFIGRRASGSGSDVEFCTSTGGLSCRRVGAAFVCVSSTIRLLLRRR